MQLIWDARIVLCLLTMENVVLRFISQLLVGVTLYAVKSLHLRGLVVYRTDLVLSRQPSC